MAPAIPARWLNPTSTDKALVTMLGNSTSSYPGQSNYSSIIPPTNITTPTLHGAPVGTTDTDNTFIDNNIFKDVKLSAIAAPLSVFAFACLFWAIWSHRRYHKLKVKVAGWHETTSLPGDDHGGPRKDNCSDNFQQPIPCAFRPRGRLLQEFTAPTHPRGIFRTNRPPVFRDQIVVQGGIDQETSDPMNEGDMFAGPEAEPSYRRMSMFSLLSERARQVMDHVRRDQGMNDKSCQQEVNEAISWPNLFKHRLEPIVEGRHNRSRSSSTNTRAHGNASDVPPARTTRSPLRKNKGRSTDKLRDMFATGNFNRDAASGRSIVTSQPFFDGAFDYDIAAPAKAHVADINNTHSPRNSGVSHETAQAQKPDGSLRVLTGTPGAPYTDEGSTSVYSQKTDRGTSLDASDLMNGNPASLHNQFKEISVIEGTSVLPTKEQGLNSKSNEINKADFENALQYMITHNSNDSGVDTSKYDTGLEGTFKTERGTARSSKHRERSPGPLAMILGVNEKVTRSESSTRTVLVNMSPSREELTEEEINLAGGTHRTQKEIEKAMATKSVTWQGSARSREEEKMERYPGFAI